MIEYNSEWHNRSGVYGILNTVTNKMYIGSTNKLGRRIGWHKDRLEKAKGRKVSKSTRELIAASMTGSLNHQYGKPSPNRGRTLILSDETKEKQRMVRKRDWDKRRGIVCKTCGSILSIDETNWAWVDESAKIAECDSCFDKRLESRS